MGASQQKGIASLMSNLIRMSTNPLEKTDVDPEQQQGGQQQQQQQLQPLPEVRVSSSGDASERDRSSVDIEAPAANGYELTY